MLTRSGTGRLLSLAALVLMVLALGGCTAEPGASVALVGTPYPTPSTWRTPAGLPAATLPAEVANACESRGPLETALSNEVTLAMTGYDGEWGFALIDIACDSLVAVNDGYAQYPASAAKLVTIIAVMRGVAAGEIAWDDVESSIRGIMEFSWDEEAYYLESFVTPEALDGVLRLARTSASSSMRGSWSEANFTAADLARVWAALVRGELLPQAETDFLLDLSRTGVIPEGFDSFPAGSTDLPGFVYGQKAGYWVTDGIPYYFAGAGYLAADAGAGPPMVAVFLARTENDDLFEPQRRTVFPLVLTHALAVADGVANGTVAAP